MSRRSQRHLREVVGKDNANQISIPGTGGGYGGGAVATVGDGVSGLPSPWEAPADFAVAYSTATTSSMSWTEPTDPGDGSTMFGKLWYRDGVLVKDGNLTSPQLDDDSTPLVEGQTYNYTMFVWDDRGRISAPSQFTYVHSNIGQVDSPLSMTILQPAGSAMSPAMIRLNGGGVANMQSEVQIDYDLDTEDPHFLLVPVTPGMSRTQVAGLIIGALASEGVAGTWDSVNNTIHATPMSPAEAVAFTRAQVV